ncbi:hypothetical protein [Pseudomonas vanderleydeniana]|uniref:Uncharacterized protein n=1 Tax=Pseudomonas vanderleydeniana TaxID=2745495 RepID=A0A9E6TTW8_9PSED|nr:hypothetical protein [Pseudomonas vanderleydeniana]QXI29951.1 hypothetical protein HU752_008360 [Pseudomonas vanderleydeniana]
MIDKDFELVKGIFSLVESGIVNGYDYFRYEARFFEGYVETELLVENGGVESENAETDFNGAVLYDLLKKLKLSADGRGEDWKSFVMSYRRGEKSCDEF